MMTVHEEVTIGDLIEKVASMPLRGYRFVTMTAVDCGDHFVIYYHFDKNYELFNMRLSVEKPGTVPSISHLCFAALVIENEIQDLFGITFQNLILDCNKHFLLSQDAPEKPFCSVPGVRITTVEAVEKGGAK